MATTSSAQPFATSALDPSLVSANPNMKSNSSNDDNAHNYNPNIYLDSSALHNPFDSESGRQVGTSSAAMPSGLVQPSNTTPNDEVGRGSANGGGGGGSVPTMIQFDPRAGSLSDDESDGEGSNPRPKKRKSQGNLRATASTQSLKSSAGGDDDDDDKSRRKIQIEYIEEKSKRHITFSKRKAGIMKKAYELSTLTGTQVLLLVVSESGWVYTFTTDKFKPLVKEDENGQLSQGQKLIAACLEAKETNSPPLPSHPSYQPPSSGPSFEANSSTVGGQISLKAQPRINPNRVISSNRRVSSKGRNHIPTAIRTGHDPNAPPVPQLPTPMTAGNQAALGVYLDQPLSSPISPRNPRSLSHPPQSPAPRGIHQMQQQQQQAMLGSGHPGAGGDYSDMLQRTDMMHMHPQGYDPGPAYDSYGSSNPNMPHHMGYENHHQAGAMGGGGHPLSDSAYELYGGHYTHHPDPYSQGGHRNPVYQTRHSGGGSSYLNEEAYVNR